MDRKKLFKIITYLIFFILVVNFLANKFYWYYSIWYLDIIMHFLGGLWIGLVSIYIFPPRDNSVNFILKILLFVLLIGIGWEVFQILVNDVVAKNPFNLLDTASDVFFDLVGGTLAILYFLKRIMLQSKDSSWGNPFKDCP